MSMTIQGLMRTTAEAIEDNETKMDRLKSQAAELTEREKAQAGSLSANERQMLDSLFSDIDQTRAARKRLNARMAEVKKVAAEESAYEAQMTQRGFTLDTARGGYFDEDGNKLTPEMIQGARAQTGDDNPVQASGAKRSDKPAYDQVMRIGSDTRTDPGQDDESSKWLRTSDGRPATVERGQRFSDHPVVRDEMARSAERDRIITGEHGSFGQYLRAMTTSGASAIVPTAWSANVIDKARNAAVVYQAGAQMVPMDAKTVQIGRLTGDPAPAFKTEGSPVTAGDMTFDYVQLVSTSLSALVVVSLEFLQDAPGADSLITNALGTAMALELDKAALFGQLGATGTNDEGAAYGLAAPYPKGILKNLIDNASGNIIGAFPTNGTAQTAATPWTEMLAVVYKPLRANEQVTAIVSNTAAVQQYDGMYDSTYQPLRKPSALANVPWLVTNTIPSYTRGTMTSRATDVFAGDFSQVLIGQRLGLEIRVLTERYAENGQVGLLAYWRGDVQVARPAALACYRALQGAL